MYKINTKSLSIIICLSVLFISSISVVNALTPNGLEYRIPVNVNGNLPDYSWIDLSYNYYNMSFAGWSFNPYISTHALNTQKISILNGKRYIFTNYGWGMDGVRGAIRAYEANQYWEPQTQISISSSPYCDFYVYTYPSLFNDKIILAGTCGNNTAFIGYFDTNTNTFHLQNIPETNYITQVYYIAERNIFVITEVVGANNDKIVTTTPENLFNPASWTYSQVINSNFVNSEHVFAYSSYDHYGYYLIGDAKYGSQLLQINMDTLSVVTTICETETSNSYNMIKGYITGDSNGVYFAQSSVTGTPSSSNPGVWNYYKYNGSLNLIGTQSMYFRSDRESHGIILPLGDDYYLCQNVKDTVEGSFYIYKENSLLQTLTGFNWHFTDNTLIKDGNKIIVGGESIGDTRITILTEGLQRKCKVDFGDVRFVSNDDITLLNYKQIVTVNGEYATFAVDTSSVTDSFYIEYGNETLSSISNESINPYLLYETFDGTSLDTDKFTDISVGDSTCTLSNGKVILTAVNSGATHPKPAFRTNTYYDLNNYPLTVEFEATGALTNDLYCTLWNGTFAGEWVLPNGGVGVELIGNQLNEPGRLSFATYSTGSSDSPCYHYPNSYAELYTPDTHKFNINFNKGFFANGVVYNNEVNVPMPGYQSNKSSSGYLGFSTREYNANMDAVSIDTFAVRPRTNALMNMGNIESEIIAPIADFTANIIDNDSLIIVQFTDTSLNNPTSWLWNFGDGVTNTTQNPIHVYNDYGDYTIRLTVMNVMGENYTEKVLTIINNNPTPTTEPTTEPTIEPTITVTVNPTTKPVSNIGSRSWNVNLITLMLLLILIITMLSFVYMLKNAESLEQKVTMIVVFSVLIIGETALIAAQITNMISWI